MSEVAFDFSSKCFAVVGATSGIGQQVMLELVRAGAHVLAIGRNVAKLSHVQNIDAKRLFVQKMDVNEASASDWQTVFQAFTGKCGKLDGLVYTAGIGNDTPLQFYDEITAKTMMETSLWGAVRCLQVFAKRRYSNDGASTVWFSSVAGHTGERGEFAYSAAKAAVRVAAYSLVHDLAKRKQRLNTLSPGWVKTPMTDGSRISQSPSRITEMESMYLLGLGEPQDISGMVLFLLSNRARWVTGSDFVIDGGLLNGVWR